MTEEGILNLKTAIEKSGLQQEIMIWGACNKSDDILAKFIEWGFHISGYIDNNYKNIGEYKGYTVYGSEELKKQKYFVYVAMRANHVDVIEKLNLFGYREFDNYWYPGRLIDLDGTENYQDLYGNLLYTENTNPITVRLRNGGKIEINTKNLNSTMKIMAEENAHVTIRENVSFGKEVVISALNGVIEIGNNCRFDSYIKVRATSGGKIYVHERCTMEKECTLVASFNARLILGKDCMLSYFITMRAGNSHNMIDLNSLVHLDDNSDRDVILGKHVWVGMHVTIMNGVYIASGGLLEQILLYVKRNLGLIAAWLVIQQEFLEREQRGLEMEYL